VTRPFGPPLRKGTIVVRRATAAQWTSANPTLLAGELGYESDTGKAKFGDGSTTWNSLSYISTWGDSVPNWLVQRDDYTLTSTTAEQKLFNESTNGALTLTAGTYEFWCMTHITGMSATSGNAAFDPVGAGTAVIEATETFFHSVGQDVNTATNAAAQVGSFTNSQQTVASEVNAAVGTGLCVERRGIITVTTGGTIIPSLSLVTAAAAVVKAGSFFMCRRLGSHTFETIGAWS
jgi:hypothetical protein